MNQRPKYKILEILEENIGANLCDLVLNNGFSSRTPKTNTTKEKNR